MKFVITDSQWNIAENINNLVVNTVFWWPGTIINKPLAHNGLSNGNSW